MVETGPPTDNFCGFTSDNHPIIVCCALSIFIAIGACLKYTTQWIKYWDYYPVKERTPLLNLLLILVLTVTVSMYPWQVIYSYVTYREDSDHIIGHVYAIGFSIFRFVPYFIYVLRSLRIYYAYNVREEMRQHWVFRHVFAKERVLLGVCVLLMVLRAALVSYTYLANPVFSPGMPESIITTISNFKRAGVDHKAYLFYYTWKKLFDDIPWTVILLCCCWIQRNIEKDLGIFNEIIWIFSIDLLYHIASTGYVLEVVFYTQDYYEVLSQLCLSGKVPTFVLIQTLQNVVMFVVSIVLPLRSRRRQHVALRVQPRYHESSDFMDFLLHEYCWKQFSDFLEHLDRKHPQQRNVERLRAWQDIIRMKQAQTNQRTVSEFLDRLDTDIVDPSLVRSLKQSVNEIGKHGEIQQTIIDSVNDRLETIHNRLLESLFTVYRKQYCRTRSFCKLDEIRADHMRINMNMNRLGMMLMTFDDD